MNRETITVRTAPRPRTQSETCAAALAKITELLHKLLLLILLNASANKLDTTSEISSQSPDSCKNSGMSSTSHGTHCRYGNGS